MSFKEIGDNGHRVITTALLQHFLLRWAKNQTKVSQFQVVLRATFQEKGKHLFKTILTHRTALHWYRFGPYNQVKSQTSLWIHQVRFNLQVSYTEVSNKTAYANSADLDQIATERAVWSGSTLFAIPLRILRNNCMKNKIQAQNV